MLGCSKISEEPTTEPEADEAGWVDEGKPAPKATFRAGLCGVGWLGAGVARGPRGLICTGFGRAGTARDIPGVILTATAAQGGMAAGAFSLTDVDASVSEPLVALRLREDEGIFALFFWDEVERTEALEGVGRPDGDEGLGLRAATPGLNFQIGRAHV